MRSPCPQLPVCARSVPNLSNIRVTRGSRIREELSQLQKDSIEVIPVDLVAGVDGDTSSAAGAVGEFLSPFLERWIDASADVGRAAALGDRRLHHDVRDTFRGSCGLG